MKRSLTNTDIIAALALILSLATVAYQVWNYFQKPDLDSILAQLIVGSSSEEVWQHDPPTGPHMVMFAAETQYVNRAPVGHDGLVLHQTLRVSVGETKVQHQGFWDLQIITDGKKIAKSHETNALPFVVQAGGVHGHWVLFQPTGDPRCLPYDSDCKGSMTWYSWDDFLKDVNSAPNPKIDLIVNGEVYGQKVITTTCSVILDEPDREILGSTGWLMKDCQAL